MIELNIPGRGLIQLEYLVSDINGTIAVDGHLLEGVTRLINELQDAINSSPCPVLFIAVRLYP